MNNLKLEVADEIAVLTISRPAALNALNSETLDELNEALTESEARDDVKVVILTGGPDKMCIRDSAEGIDQPLDGQLSQRYHALLEGDRNAQLQRQRPHLPVKAQLRKGQPAAVSYTHLGGIVPSMKSFFNDRRA